MIRNNLCVSYSPKNPLTIQNKTNRRKLNKIQEKIYLSQTANRKDIKLLLCKLICVQ